MHTLDGRGGGATLLRELRPADELPEGRAWLDEPPIPHLTLRLTISTVLAAQLVVFALAGRSPTPRATVDLPWLELALATPVVLWAGLPLYERALASFRRRHRADMFTLVSLGTLTAYVYSVLATFGATPSPAGSLFFGAAAVTVTLVLAGEALERFARERTTSAIGDLGTAQRVLAPRATHIELLADRISAALVPAVLAVAAITFVGWLALGPAPRLAHAVASAVAVLVIASPAAIGLATPLPFLVATLGAKRSGIRLRDAETTETLANVTTLVVERTGVLTEWRPHVHAVEPAGGFAAEELVNIVTSEPDRGPQSTRRAIPGRGAPAAGAQDVLVGDDALLESYGIVIPDHARARGAMWTRAGSTVSYVAVDRGYVGLVAASDAPRRDAGDAIAQLRQMGVRVVMMTGAPRMSGQHIARELGLHEAEVYADMRPGERAKAVARLAARGEVVAVAACGERDERAASVAHVAITLGSGERTSISVPDGDLASVVRAIRLARRTARTVRQNLAIAIGYNLLAIPFAAIVGYVALGAPLSPMIAAAAMGLGTLTVIASSLRLLRPVRQ